MRKETRLFQKLRYTQGERDAAKGVKPKHDDRDYLRGYSRQYEHDQKVNSRSEAF